MTGRTIAHYEILEQLGEGGMGVVYKARDTRLNRFVAHILRPAAKLADEERLRRFTQEARTASGLNHPNIITIHDISSADGLPYIVMEFVAGKTLDQLIPRKGMRLAEVLKIAVQIAEALAAAAAAGVIHRDIKPGNVMVSESGHVKVLDFGLAKLSERALSAEQSTATILQDAERPHTREGTVIGTVSYMSPEQAEGKPVDPRSDIFSFGALLYEMVTGQRAFRGDSSMSTISAILRDDPTPAGQLCADVPRDLDKIIARCLRKDPERRFQTMADVRVSLLELKEESESGKLPATAVTPPAKSGRGWIFASCTLLLIAAAAVLVFRQRQTATAPGPEPKVTPLTSYAGAQGSPTFSPDGNQIAFSWSGGSDVAASHIYAKLIGTESPLQLTSGTDRDISPAWAPDGRSIAFIRFAVGSPSIYLVPPLGGNPRRVAQIDSPDLSIFGVRLSLTWTKDGKNLLVAGRLSAGQYLQILVISVETGQMRALALGGSGSAGMAVLSPDERHLAFSNSSSDFISELMLADLNEHLEVKGAPRKLKTDGAINYPIGWTADGKEILIISGGGRERLILRIPADGSAPPRALAGINDNVFTAAVSRQGDRLAYTRIFSDDNIWNAPLNGPGRLGAPSMFLASTRSDTVRPNAYSSDGRRLAIESDRSGKRTIWTANSDGTQPAPVLPGDAFTTGSPAWSPDGRWLAFDSRRDGNPEIYVISADGGPARRITNHPSKDHVPSWSHDGKSIYFSSDRTGRFEIFKVPSAGGETVQITRNGGWGTQESADGKYLYYARTRGPNDTSIAVLPAVSLLRMPAEGGEETLVMEGVRDRSWAVTAEGVWYLWAESLQRGELRFFDFKTRKTSSPLTMAKPLIVGLALSPDGTHLLFNQRDQQGSEILLMENFR